MSDSSTLDILVGQLPCLAASGAQIFAPTADQRYLAGVDEFLRTHFPMRLQWNRPDHQVTTLTERDVLRHLLDQNDSVRGNRVFILYGAAGSGKSELLRWLQVQIGHRDASRAAVMARISRTDLDVVHIVQRIQHTFGLPPLREASLRRWEECRQKPRTLAKMLVLSALEQLLGSDEQVNALYYQLIDVVQTNLEHCFQTMSQPSQDMGQFIELFSREDLQEILRASVIPVSIEYETLRFYLLRAFRELLMEGLDFQQTLRQIARRVQEEKSQRPILLIDDLVQSINLFATELLDYFITLEEGCWDVVIGITPHSLDSTLRGKELLDRITYLDTIDDRVQKLSLSDEYGLSSSFLDEANCTEYARLYLNEYKKQNLQLCDATCPAFHRCHHLDPERSENLLAPFNREVLVRLFRSLPPGKGRARYFTLYLRDILLRLAQGEQLLAIMQEYVKPEQAVYHRDGQLAQIYELYGPLAQEQTVAVAQVETERLHHFFRVRVSDSDAELPVVASLYHRQEQPERTAVKSETVIDPGKEAIKVWLRGDAVNKQLLRNLRRGIVKAVKEAYPLDTMTRLYTAKPTRVLRWAQTRLDTVPPVALEGIDDFEGLLVERSIGPCAYMLHDFADIAGHAEYDMRSHLLAQEAFPALLFKSSAYQGYTHESLEKQLAMQIEELAFALFILAGCFHGFPVQLPASLQEKLERDLLPLPRYPEELEALRPRLTGSQQTTIKRLFDDCFKLRENLYDGLLLELMAERVDRESALELLQAIDTAGISSDYRLWEEPLGDFLRTIQHAVAALAQCRTNPEVRLKLIKVCRAGLGTDEVAQRFASLVGLSNSIEASIAYFLEHCTLLELHRALHFAHIIEVAQYEQLLLQFRSLLVEVGDGHFEGAVDPARGFSREEIDILITFTRQEFHMPLSQLEMPLLAKVAQQLPWLYQQLEVRLQRG